MEQNPLSEQEKGQSPSWDKLAWWSRRKLQAAHTIRIMMPRVGKDMADRPVIFALSLLPGPNPVVPLIMASYLFRRDRRAKEVKAMVRTMFRKGVPLKHYEDTLVYDERNDRYKTDDGKLTQKKIIFVKDVTIDTGLRTGNKLGEYYGSAKSWTKGTLSGVFQKCAEPVIGKNKSEKTLSAIFNAGSMGEKAVGTTAQYAGKSIAAGWNAVSSLWSRKKPPSDPPPPQP